MMKVLGLLMKRPSDTQVRYAKLALGAILILTGILAFNIQKLSLENSIFGFELTNQVKIYLSYAIMAIGAFPLVLG